MLILSRKVGETIRIGADISITLIAMRGERSQWLVTAPRDTRVRLKGTDPVWLRRRAERRAARKSSGK
jgi:hypothetical protein